MSELEARLRLSATGGPQAAGEVGQVESALQKVAPAAEAAAGGAKKAAAAISQMGDGATEAAHDFATLYDATQRDFSQQYVAQMKASQAAQTGVARTAKLTGAEMLNLSRQFSDVGVTAAMGMNPLMIFIQQGPQLAETFATASARGITFTGVFRAVAAAAWAAVAPLAPFVLGAAAIAAVVGGGLLIATKELNAGHKDLAKSLGLTEEQLKKVKNTGITMGDVLKGSFAAAGAGLKSAFAPQIEWLQKAFKDAYRFIVDGSVATLKGMVSAFGYAGGAIGAIFKNIPAVIQDYLISAANLGIGAIEGLVNAGVSALNKMIGQANLGAKAVGLPFQLTTLELQKIPRLANSAAGALTEVGAAGRKGAKEAVDGARSMVDALEAAIVKSATARIKEEAGTATATRAVQDHTRAVKENITAIEQLTIDRATLVDLTKVEGIKPFKPEDLVPTSESLGRVFEDQRREIENLAGYMEDQFARSGKLAFGDIAHYAKEELRRAVYQALLAKPIQLIIDAVVRGLPSGSGGLSGLLASPAGVAGLVAAGGAVIGGKTGRAVATGASIAGIGLSAGASLAGATATGGILAGLGGATAGLAGFAPLLGPIGIIAGAAVVLASLLGPKPTNAGAGVALTPTGLGAITGNKRTAETEKAATTAAQAILDGQQLLRNAGITLGATVSGLVVGTRDLSQIYLTNGKTLTSAVGDGAAAIEVGLKATLEGATFASAAQKTLVEGMLAAGKGFDDIAAGLEGYARGQQIPDSIEKAILKLTDPKAFALDELKTAQKAERDALKAAADAGYLTAAQFEAAGASLGKLEGLQLADTLKSFSDAVNESREALQDQADSLGKSVGDRILEFTNPTAAKVKRITDEIDARMAEAAKLVSAGVIGPEILGQIETLRGLELDKLFGELAANVNTSARAFEEARPRLLSWLDGLRVGASAELSPRAQREEALRQYEAQLAKARSGDAGALSDLTGYADRLISADRSATSSASARAGLRSRILGEVEGLTGLGGANSIATLASVLQAPLSTIAQASAADLAAAAAGGKAVVIGNLPSMQAMYGAALTSQTDRLVAANDRNAGEIVASVKALAEQQRAVFDQLAQHLDGALAAVAESGAATAAEIAAGLGRLEEQQRLADALNRQAS